MRNITYKEIIIVFIFYALRTSTTPAWLSAAQNPLRQLAILPHPQRSHLHRRKYPRVLCLLYITNKIVFVHAVCHMGGLHKAAHLCMTLVYKIRHVLLEGMAGKGGGGRKALVLVHAEGKVGHGGDQLLIVVGQGGTVLHEDVAILPILKVVRAKVGAADDQRVVKDVHLAVLQPCNSTMMQISVAATTEPV